MSKKTYMTRCPHKDCFRLMPVGANGCDRHQDDTRICATEGCKTAVSGKSTYCVSCSYTRRLKSYRRSKERVTTAYEQIEVMTPKRRFPVEIVKTSTQVDRECRKEERRLAAVRETLNQDLLAIRMMGRAICDYRV